jgi:hypothetical protein
MKTVSPKKQRKTRTGGVKRRSTPHGEAGRSDTKFRWAADKSLDRWRNALATWTMQHSCLRRAVGAGNTFLDYLWDCPTVTRDPKVFCRRDYTNPVPFNAWLKQRGKERYSKLDSTTWAFIEWFLRENLTPLGKDGRPLRSAKHWNPLIKPVRPGVQHNVSVRTALPSRMTRELLQILIEDDWAWARQQRQDFVSVTEDGVERDEWCRVRASALALLLLLPLRPFQVRMLESGEGDTQNCRNGEWVANEGPHAPKLKKPVRRGVLRAFPVPTDKTITGFFINTNKSVDRLPGEEERGYEIPWQHEQAIRVIEELRDWQERYNPVEQSLPWSEIDEELIRLATKMRPDGAFFLFRDPNGHTPNQPLTYGRLKGLWVKLLAELERRYAQRGERLPSGAPILLTKRVTNRKGKTVIVALFDLHSLRVSLITMLSTEGKVPLETLSRCIAGHASILMTLYYVKDVGQTAECMAEASKKIDAASQQQFARFLRSQDRKAAGIVSNDPLAITLLDQQPEVSWKFMSMGVCPVGGTMCAKGGPPLPGQPGKHGPVPGGSQNCARCRFFLTGPAFLYGLASEFNLTSLRLEKSATEWRTAQAERRALEDERFDTEQAGSVFDEAKLARAHGRVETAETRVLALAENLQALSTLVERSAATQASVSSSGLNLVLGGTLGDLKAVVRETQRLELLDAVCQAATLHPNSEELEASLRRNVELHQLLDRRGYKSQLMMLNEIDGVQVGNEMMNLMRQHSGGNAVELLSVGSMAMPAAVAEQLDQLFSCSLPGVGGAGKSGHAMLTAGEQRV